MAKKPNRVIFEENKRKYIPTQNVKTKKIDTPLADRRRIRSLKNSAMTRPFPAGQMGTCTEEEINTLKQQMEFILGVTKTGLDIIDSNLNIRYIDPEWAKVYGDPAGKKCYEYFMDRNQVCPDCGIPTALETKKITVTEEVLVKEGNRPIQVTTIPFQNSQGEWLVAEVNVDISERKRAEETLRKAHEELEIRVKERTAELARASETMQAEITERKRVEDALRETERFLTSIFTSLQDGITILDNDMNIIRVNQTMEHWYSHAMPLVGKKCYEAFHGRSQRCEICPTSQTIDTGKAAYEVVPKIGARGENAGWLDLYSFPLIDTVTGRMRGVIEYVRDITERKRAEETLRQSEEKYRTILENIQEGYFEVDLAGNYIFFNDAECVILGYSRDELIRMNNRQYTDEEDAKKVFQAFNNLHRTGVPIKELDYEIIRKDGTKAFTEISASLIRDSEGKPIGFRGISRDVTERKKLEEVLREREERYRTLLETMKEGYFEVDLKGRFTFFNEALCKMHAFSDEEMLGMSNRQYMDEATAQKVYKIFNQVYKTGQPGEISEWEIIRRDSKKAILESSVYLIRNSKGEPVGFRGITRDATERKRAEEALLNAAQQWRTTFDGISDIVCLLDREGRILKCNKAMTDLLGKPFSDIINRTHLEIVQGAQMPIEGSLVERLWKTHRRETDILLINDRWFSIAVDPLLDETGRLAGAVHIMSDVTERKRAEEATRESEKRYRQVIENAVDIIYTTDANGNFTYANSAALTIAGYSLEELQRLNYLNLVLPEHRDRVSKIYISQFRERQATTYVEFPFFNKSGHVLWFGQNASLVIEGEKPVGFHIIARDITERKQAEEALRRSEEKYRTILDEMEEGYFEIDLAGNFTFINDAACRNIGYPREELIGMNNRQYADEKNAKKVFQAFNNLYRTGQPCRVFDYEVTKKDGTKVITELSASLMRNSEGKPIGFRGISRYVTERKKMEEALREREEQYRTLLETMEEGYYEVDLAGNLTFINDSFSKMHARDTMLGMNNREYMSKETARRVYEIFNRVYKTGQPMRLVEWEIIKGNGEKAIVEASVYLIKNSRGERIGFRGIERDITERKQAEEALRQSEERYRNILESIQDGYFEVDLAGNFTFLNDSMCRIFGHPKEELIGMNDRQYTDKENARRLFQAFNRVYETGERGRIVDYEIIQKDGAKRHVETSFSLTKDSSGKPIGFRGIIRDITERKQAEEALRRSEERYRTIIENIQDGYFENDLAGNFTFANDVICRHLGYTKEELMGINYRQYADEENCKKLYQRYNGLYRTGVPIKILEVGYITKDGAKVIAEISTSLMRNSEGKPIGFRGISRDITERKQAEEERLSLQEQLRQSQKMEAIGRLAGGVAHDFNNLLTVIKGYSQLSLLDLKEDDPLWGNVKEIEKATQRATDLTRQLLAFSRRQILDFKVVDLNALLKDLDKMLRRIIGEDIELVTLLSGDLGKVKIDPSQIEQVIFNLAVNARDAMPSGGKLTIETSNAELDEAYAHAHVSVIPGRYVRLSVSDTGVGMSKEVKEKVFEPFFTTKDKGKGTGLGLSMVYGIVKQSNGNIWVYSEPGHGTTFKIYLPRIEGEADTLRERDETDFFPKGSETVLLVEDDELVRDLGKRLLIQQGYRVLEAANGEEALRVVQEHDGETIHLLLADIVMPQMGGKALADQLKILRSDVKVLYTSGYADDAIVHHGVLDPGTHFLQKPFSLKTLSQKVREALDR